MASRDPFTQGAIAWIMLAVNAAVVILNVMFNIPIANAKGQHWLVAVNLLLTALMFPCAVVNIQRIWRALDGNS